MTDLSAAVLCGGRSRRMGRDKAALPFGGESLLARAARTASLVSDDVVLVAPQERPDLGAGRWLADAGEGPLVALSAALRSARRGSVLLLACDMPLVTPDLLQHLLSLAGEGDAVVPRVGGIAVPTCAIYKRAVLDVAEPLVARGARALHALLDRISVRWVDEDELRIVDPDLVGLIDCDTPESYAQAMAIAAAADRRD